MEQSPAGVEDLILSVGGHLRAQLATTKLQHALDSQVGGEKFMLLNFICSNPSCGGTFTTMTKVKCPLCKTFMLPIMMNNSQIRYGDQHGSRWALVDSVWKMKGSYVGDEFKLSNGIPLSDLEKEPCPVAVPTDSETVKDMAKKGLLFASDFPESERRDSSSSTSALGDHVEGESFLSPQTRSSNGVIFAPDMIDHKALKTTHASWEEKPSEAWSSSARTQFDTTDLNAATGIALVILQWYCKTVRELGYSSPTLGPWFGSWANY
jgi:hypothetical protein